MAVTIQRPVIGPGSGVAFAFVAGRFLWSLDGSHEEILTSLNEKHVPHDQSSQGIWGWVTNESNTQAPQYTVELYSDLFGVPQNQQHVQDCYQKLHAYLHQFTITEPQPGQAVPFNSSWKRSAYDDKTGNAICPNCNVVMFYKPDDWNWGGKPWLCPNCKKDWADEDLPPDRYEDALTLPWGEDEQEYYRTSSQNLMYHVSLPENRDGIQTNGLHPAHDQTGLHAVYLSENPLPSHDDEYGDLDVWQVFTGGLDLEPDASTPGFQDWWMSKKPIGPERLSLLDPQDLEYMAKVAEFDPEQWAGDPSQWEGWDNAPDGSAPKYDIGERVNDGFGLPGTIRSVMYNRAREEWNYVIDIYDDQGAFDQVLMPEKDLQRAPMMHQPLDQPSGWTMKDFGIPPEGEDFYRQSAWEFAQPGHPDYDSNLDPDTWNVGDKLAMPVFDSHPTLWDYFTISDMTPSEIVLSEVGGFHKSMFNISRDNWVNWCREWQVQRIEEGDPSTEYAEKMWPDTLPWKEDEQDYYRQSALEHGEHDFNRALTPEEIVTQCMYCARFRQPDGSWNENNPMPGSPTSHGICPDCWTNVAPGLQYPTSSWTRESADGTMGDMNPTGTLQSSLEASPAASAAYQALTQAGGQVYIVGGAVRDSMMGKDPKDIDMMCSGLDEDQMELALQGVGRLDFTGKAFGVFRLRVGNDEVEIALPRTERSTGSGHKEFEVTTDPHLPVEADLSRRDFTWNAMAYDPSTQALIDPHGGQNDLVNGRMALVNDQAFEDDPLRIVRAMVATARYGFEADPALLKSMSENASAIRHLPGERIQMEFDKLMSAPNPVAAMQMAENTGLLDYIVPELSSTVGFDQQNPHHNLNVWDHTMAVLTKMTSLSNDPDMRLAALFHDSGKPESFWVDPNAPEGGGGHFYKKIQDDGTEIGQNHEDVGAQNVRAFMERLRYPTKRIDRVEKLVALHMFPYFNSAKGARKFLQAAGDSKMAFDLLTFREADSSGKDGITPKEFDANMLKKDRELLQQVLEESHAVSVKDLDISGKDLIEIGFKPGPELGQMLNKLLDLVMEDPSLNEKDKLMQKVRELR